MEQSTLRSVDAVCRPPQNKLLAALPAKERERIQRHLLMMDALPGDILGEPRLPLEYGYFPITSIVSIQQVTTDGVSVEVAAVGSAGFAGVSLFLGGGPAANRMVVQNKGQIYRVRKEIIQAEFSRGSSMQLLLLRYTQDLLAQISQTSGCNQRHSIDQQLARWLLQTLDRLSSTDVLITHELLAHTLGVRRERITEAARKLQLAGLINYQRGRILVVNRRGLEARSCECYAVIRHAHAKFYGETPLGLPRRSPAAQAESANGRG